MMSEMFTMNSCEVEKVFHDCNVLNLKCSAKETCSHLFQLFMKQICGLFFTERMKIKKSKSHSVKCLLFSVTRCPQRTFHVIFPSLIPFYAIQQLSRAHNAPWWSFILITCQLNRPTDYNTN